MVETTTRRIKSKTHRQFSQNMVDVHDFLTQEQMGLANDIVEMGTALFGEDKFGTWLAGDNVRLGDSPIAVIKQGEQGQQRVANILGMMKLKRDICLN